MWRWVCMPWCTCGGQRATCKSCFSYVGSRDGTQVFRPVPLTTEPSHSPDVLFGHFVPSRIMHHSLCWTHQVLLNWVTKLLLKKLNVNTKLSNNESVFTRQLLCPATGSPNNPSAFPWVDRLIREVRCHSETVKWGLFLLWFFVSVFLWQGFFVTILAVLDLTL